jgi:methionyl-tRNA formyltransferase
MKYKVTFLLDKSNLWFEKQVRNYNFKLNNKYIFKISKNPNNIKNQNIVFPLSYTKILPESFLQKNELVLIAHLSKLPKDKGFAPLQCQILKNKKKVYISLIKAAKEVDAGSIYYQNSFMLYGTELSDEIRYIQGLQILKIINKFLIKYPNVKSKKQSGKSNFNKRRYPKDSELNVNKTIKQQFNHLRINDNELYPSFFYFKGQKYIIQIFKEKN